MISNQILQSTIEGLKNITKVDLCVTDTEGKVIAGTYGDLKNYEMAVHAFIETSAESQEVQGGYLFKIYDEYHLEYVLFVQGEEQKCRLLGELAVFQIQSLLVAYKERFDKDNFIKNLLLDNLLLVDIYNRAKKLHIDTDARRVVFIVEITNDKNEQRETDVDSSIDKNSQRKCLSGKDSNMLERVRGILGEQNKDFITAVDEKNIIIVKQLSENAGYRDMERYACEMFELLKQDNFKQDNFKQDNFKQDNFKQEGVGQLHIAYGTIVNDIREVSKSYKEAKLALDVGKIFFGEKDIIAYNTLGIGRLIYQLPIPLCKMFIREIFEGKSPDDFDEETLTTINKFFENSLNVSETSRQLYIHRNTLVYRLDKIQKSTGLDLRVFEDAITFKIALMVVKYMKYMEKSDYYNTEY